MARWWQADDAFFDTLRDREVMGAILAEVAGDTVARANAREKGKTIKAIVRAHLDGSDGRARIEDWVPRWMRFAPSGYTARGGVGTVAAAEILAAIGAGLDEERRTPDPEAERLAA
jgi:ParB family chromosome partitioning protein